MASPGSTTETTASNQLASRPAAPSPSQSPRLPHKSLDWLSGEFTRCDAPHAVTEKSASGLAAVSVASVEARSTENAGQGRVLLRKRFYPAQWFQLAKPKLESILISRGLQVQWSGWQRSLPRLYLAPEALTRLLTEAIDAVACQILALHEPHSKARAPLSIRVSGQAAGASNCLVIVIEHPNWQCNRSAQMALNSPSMLTSSDMRFDRVRRQTMALGGSVSVSPAIGGGACMRFSIPTDELRALVRAWLETLLTRARAAVSASEHVHLFLVARRMKESAQQAMAADERLQALIDPEELVVRVDHARWFWLRQSPELPMFIRNHAWHTARAASWPLSTQLSKRSLSEVASSQLAQAIAATMQRMMGRSIPPLDRLIEGYENRDGRASDIAMQHHLALNRPARWRYPI